MKNEMERYNFIQQKSGSINRESCGIMSLGGGAHLFNQRHDMAISCIPGLSAAFAASLMRWPTLLHYGSEE
jgi:hypothetical protein